MALNKHMLYLICYDIRDPKRLLRVHRFLRNEGMPVQYSVFTAALTARELRRLLGGLKFIMDERRDDIRVYPLPSKPVRWILGRQFFPDDVLLIEDGFNLLPGLV